MGRRKRTPMVAQVDGAAQPSANVRVNAIRIDRRSSTTATSSSK
jgi:hypothetical protein